MMCDEYVGNALGTVIALRWEHGFGFARLRVSFFFFSVDSLIGNIVFECEYLDKQCG